MKFNTHKRITAYLKEHSDVFDESERISKGFQFADESWKEEVKQRTYNRRKLVLSYSAASIAIIIFFIFATPGQALAKGFANTFIKLFGGEIAIEHTVEKDSEMQIVLAEGEYSFSTIEEAAKAMGRELVYFNGNVDSIIIHATIHDEIQTVTTIYELNGETELLVMQDFLKDVETISLRSFMETDQVTEVLLFNYETMFCSKNEDAALGISIWDNCSLMISSENDSLNELVDKISLLRETK